MLWVWQGRRRLRQSSQSLTKAGVQLSVEVTTTGALLLPVQSALSSAAASNQLVNAYNAQNGARPSEF